MDLDFLDSQEQAVTNPPEPAVKPESEVSVIIVTYNGGSRVVRCLQALERQTFTPKRILVFDNDSSDGTVARIRKKFPAVEIRELGQNLGLAGARNIGLQLVETALVLLVDDDIYLEEACLEKLSAAMQVSGASVVCPRFVIYPEGDIVQFDGAAPHFVGTMTLRHGYQPLDSLPTKTTAVDACGGGCMLLKRAEILAAGGFNKAFFIYFEDLEFSYRLRSQGYQIACQPEAVAYHDLGRMYPGLTFRGGKSYPARKAFLIVRNRLLTFLIHYRARSLVILFPALLLYEFASALILLLRGLSRQWLRAWLWLWQNKVDILRWRKQAQQKRVMNDRDLLHGGPLPLAPGFADKGLAKEMVALLSTSLNLYWRTVRRWIG